MTPKIQIVHLKKSFGKNHVLRDINFSVNPGESLVIIGASGTGKSVSIKCILGLIDPDSGVIEVDGINILKLATREREQQMKKFGMLFQGGALFDSLSVWENVAFGLIYNQRMAKIDAKKIALQKLEDVGLDASIGTLAPVELSGGMQKRVALARAIATSPEIILFDEPTTGLDPIMCHVIDSLITKCVKKLGATTITITHDLQSVRRIADKVAMIHEGEIIWHGPIKEMDTTDNPYVRQFVGGLEEGPITPKTEAKV